jgi:TolA-binding protein
MGALGGIAYAAHIGGALFGGILAGVVRAWLPEPSMAEEWSSTPTYTGVSGAWNPGASSGMPETQNLAPLRNIEPTYAAAVPGPATAAAPPDHAPLDDVAQALAEGNQDKAIQLFRQHESMRPGDSIAPSSMIAVGHVLWARAQFPEALDVYRSFAERHAGEPEAPLAKFRAAVILARRMEACDDASKLLLQVVMEHPDPEIVGLARSELSRIRQLA